MHGLRICYLIRTFFEYFPRIQSIISHNQHSHIFPYSFYGKNLISRYLFTSNVYIYEKRKWAVSHLSAQELGVSALHRLELEVNKFNRANLSDIQLILKGDFKDMLEEKSIFLLRCCGALLPNQTYETRVDLTNAIWNKICLSGTQLSNAHFNALLSTYIENSHHICPKDFLSDMKRMNVEPDRDTLIKLLSCCGDKKSPKDAMDNLVIVVTELKSRGYTADVEMFEALSSTLADSGHLEAATDIIETMRKVKLKPTAAVYTSLIKGYVNAEDKASILRILNEMENQELLMTGRQFASVITVLAEKSHLFKSKGSQSAFDISNIIQLMRVSDSEDIQRSITNEVLELVYKRKENVALQIVLSLPSSLLVGHRFLEPLPILLCKEVVRADAVCETVIEICDQLEGLTVPLLRIQGFLEPYLLHTALGLSLSLGKKSLSIFLLEAIFLRGTRLRTHYFWPIMCLIRKNDEGRESIEGIQEVLKKMIELGVEPDFETLVDYVLPAVDPKKSALHVLTLLRKNGITGIKSITAVTHWLLSNGDLQQAAKFNEVHHGKIDPALILEPLSSSIVKGLEKSDRALLLNMARLLKSLSVKGIRGVDYIGLFLIEVCEKLGFCGDNGKNSAEGMQKAVEYVLIILKVLDQKNLSISSQAADYILYIIQPILDMHEIKEESKMYMPRIDSTLTLARSEKFQDFIPHPREMTLEELECHLLELRAKGLNERGVLRRLLQLHCRLGNMERALQIKDDMDSAGHSFSAGMLSSLLDLYLQHNILAKSEEIYKSLRKNHPNFKLDDFKVIDLATLMIKNGKFNDALKLLKEHSRIGKLRPGPSIERNIISLLNTVQALKIVELEKNNHNTISGELGDKGSYWSVDIVLSELIKLGYVTNPPPKSLCIFKKLSN